VLLGAGRERLSGICRSIFLGKNIDISESIPILNTQCYENSKKIINIYLCATVKANTYLPHQSGIIEAIIS